MAVLDVILFSNFVHPDRGPGLGAKTEEDIHPTFAQMLAERAELMIEIILSTDCANDFLDRDFLHADELSIDTGAWRFGKTCQPRLLAREFCPDQVS
jgi:myo-inositol catabolism protein IolC